MAANVRNGLIIKEMVTVRKNTWEVIVNISDEIRKETVKMIISGVWT